MSTDKHQRNFFEPLPVAEDSMSPRDHDMHDRPDPIDFYTMSSQVRREHSPSHFVVEAEFHCGGYMASLRYECYTKLGPGDAIALLLHSLVQPKPQVFQGQVGRIDWEGPGHVWFVDQSEYDLLCSYMDSYDAGEIDMDMLTSHIADVYEGPHDKSTGQRPIFELDKITPYLTNISVVGQNYMPPEIVTKHLTDEDHVSLHQAEFGPDFE